MRVSLTDKRLHCCLDCTAALLINEKLTPVKPNSIPLISGSTLLQDQPPIQWQHETTNHSDVENDLLKMRLSSLPFLDDLIDATICCVQQEQNCMRRHPHTFPRDGQQRVDSPSTHVAMWRQLVTSEKNKRVARWLAAHTRCHVETTRQRLQKKQAFANWQSCDRKKIMHWPSEKKDSIIADKQQTALLPRSSWKRLREAALVPIQWDVPSAISACVEYVLALAMGQG